MHRGPAVELLKQPAIPLGKGGTPDRQLAVLRFAALAAIVRSKIFEADQHLTGKLRQALGASWSVLGGSAPSAEQLLGPLPPRTLLSMDTVVKDQFRKKEDVYQGAEANP